MPRLTPIDRETVTGRTQELLEEVRAEFGMVPNIFCTMANSPVVLESFLGTRKALQSGVLPDKLRELIALTVSEVNHSNYCVCGHAALGKSLGCSDDEIMDARRGVSSDKKTEAALRFAHELVEKRGWVTEEAFHRLQDAGYEHREITEIIACVSQYIFTDYLSQVAELEIDFPRVPELVGV